MPKITVEIEWDYPCVDDWVSATHVEQALQACYGNKKIPTKFLVRTEKE